MHNRLSPRSRTLSLLLLAAISSLAIPAQLHSQSNVPFVSKHIYSTTANPTADISAAIAKATREHKHIILDFGGDWCPDCQILDIYFHQQPNADLLARHFVVVHVDIGQMDHNIAVANKYHVPVTKGVPALAVLDSHGKLLYAQQNKEFEHNVTAQAITEFLNRWKA